MQMPPQQPFTKEQLTAMPMAELVETYNSISGKKAIKRFSKRERGIELVLKSQATKTVTNGEKTGRPNKNFTLIEAEGKTKVRGASLRGKIMAHINGKPKGVTLKELEEQFGVVARGAVQKLMEVGWLKREDKEVEA
jgi:chromosome segregation and condensation protein ScpB